MATVARTAAIDARACRIALPAIRQYSDTTMDETSSADDAPDAALLVAFANGDGDAGRLLLDRLAPRLFGYATRALGDRTEAEDVVQETMLRLWKIAPEWRQGEAQVSTWAYRVAVNLCTDRLRKRKTRGQVGLDTVAEPEADQPSVVEQMTETDRVMALQNALATLPERQREAVVLRHLEGHSNPEIATILGLSVEAVESLTARGKRALKAALVGRKEELGYANDRSSYGPRA